MAIGVLAFCSMVCRQHLSISLADKRMDFRTADPQIQFGRERLEFPLGTAVGPNWLGIYSGSAPCSFRSHDEREWTRDWITLQVGRTFSSHEFKHALATVSLAGVINEDEGHLCGWAVDEASADLDADGRVLVRARVAVRGRGTELLRISYHVVVLAEFR
jgi:hypothetical protein